MHCTIMSLAHVWLISLIGNVYTMLKLEVVTEQVQVEDFTNLKLTQGKPQCIPPKTLSFMFETLFIMLYACALSL
jgi:hypothetical protein